MQPRKKMYEQALMVRKVKSYLSNIGVIDCETELDRLSLECEAGNNSSNINRRRVPSPSPSSLSSVSSTSDQRKFAAPKFGWLFTAISFQVYIFHSRNNQ